MSKQVPADTDPPWGFVSGVVAAALLGVFFLFARQWTAGMPAVLLLAVAVVTLLYVATVVGSWCFVAVIARVVGEPLPSDRWAMTLLGILFVASIPLSGMAYGFDRDQWIWTTVPLPLAALITSAVLLRRRSQLKASGR